MMLYIVSQWNRCYWMCIIDVQDPLSGLTNLRLDQRPQLAPGFPFQFVLLKHLYDVGD